MPDDLHRPDQNPDQPPGQESGQQTGQQSDNPRRPGFAPPFADLPEKILALLRASPAGELEQHVRALVSQTADKLDLVSREEFEIQQAMVERLRQRVEKLEAELARQPD